MDTDCIFFNRQFWGRGLCSQKLNRSCCSRQSWIAKDEKLLPCPATAVQNPVFISLCVSRSCKLLSFLKRRILDPLKIRLFLGFPDDVSLWFPSSWFLQDWFAQSLELPFSPFVSSLLSALDNYSYSTEKSLLSFPFNVLKQKYT